MKNILGALTGMLLGLTVTTYAQNGIFTFGQPIELSFTQVSTTTPDKICAGIIYDSQPEVVVGDICTGVSSPYNCVVPIPQSARTVGNHSIIVRTGHKEYDNTISWNVANNTYPYIVTPAKIGAPPPPTNIIIRLIQIIGNLLGII